MADVAPDSPTQPSELPQLIATVLERMEAEGPAAVDAACAAHPHWADLIRARISLLRGMGLLAEHTPPPGTFPDRLGSFRLVQCLGGGGMGVVYLAVQEPLGRQVALKLIRPENLYFPGARERFQREAEAVARLQHPGIVPVYTAGEENGVPYFAMEYVHGASLDQVRTRLAERDPASLTGDDLRRAIDPAAPPRSAGSSDGHGGLGRTWVGACLRIALAVGEALAHAHARGVLHRDIKPSNIMLTADGRVLLLDFGLAELRGATRLTRTGSQLGSLSYMAPEQVRGDTHAIDERTDIYALGVTLYELLTSRVPYHDAQAARLQQQILVGVPRPLREHNRAVPWDVETVCLTAMERDRGRRYASATAFADDLRRLIELRPITAQRPGVALRARRFVQRRPATSVAIALGTLLLVGGPAVLAWVEHSANLAIQRALDGERKARGRAHANLERSFRALDQLAIRLAEDRLASVPHMTGLRRDLLASALAIYQDILKDQADDPEAQLRAADMARRVGAIQWELGQAEAALSALDQSLRLLDRVLAQAPGDPTARTTQALARRTKADLLASRGELTRAATLWREALDGFADLAREQPDDSYRQWSLAQARSDFAGILEELGQPQAADAERQQAVTMLEQELARHPEDPELGPRLATVLANLGAGQLSRHQPAAARSAILRALDLVMRQPATRIAHRTSLATLQSNLGLTFLEESQPAEAEGPLRQALELTRALVRDFPAEPVHRASLSQTLVYLGTALKDAGRPADAGPFVAEAIAVLRQLLAEQPGAPDFTAALANALGERADLSVLESDLDAARQLYAESQQTLERLIAANPRAERHHINLAYTLDKQAGLLLEADEFAAARAMAERALQELALARGISADNRNGDDLTVTAAMTLGRALAGMGDHAGIVGLVETLVALRRDTAGFTFRCGWLMALAARLAAEDERGAPAERDAQVERDVAAALTFLERAAALGWSGLRAYLQSSDARVLRRSPRFAILFKRS